MDENIKAALRERINLGYTRAEIITEFTEAGYPAAEAGRLYDLVANETPVKPFDPDQLPTVVQEDIIVEHETKEGPSESQAPLETPASAPTPSATPTPTLEASVPSATQSRFSKAAVASLVVAVLLLGAGAVYGFVTFLLPSAPYETESEMVKGMLMHTTKLTAHGFNLSYHGAVEQRNESALVFDQRALPEDAREEFSEGLDMMIQFGALPAEVDAKVDVSGLVDLRDKEHPEFDISANLHLLAEPIIINAAGSLRMTEGVLYGKVDDLPANFAPFLGEVPTEKWIILADESDMTLPSDIPFPVSSPQVLNVVPAPVREVLVSEMKRLTTLPLQYAEQSQDYLSAQAAQVGMPLLEVMQGEEEQKMLERSMELLVKYPPLKFIGEPEKVELNSESVYQYAVDIDFDNLRTYLLEMSKEAEVITGEVLLPVEMAEEAEFFIKNKALLAETNRLTNIKYNFRADGSFAGFSFDTAFTFDHPELKQQFRLEVGLTTTRQNDAMDITAPEDVHEKTLGEILSSQFSGALFEAQTNARDASIKSTLSMMRVQAEFSYNENGYSYAQVCTGEDMQPLLEQVVVDADLMEVQHNAISDMFSVTCNDSADSYAVLSPLPDDFGAAFCVDSTGFAGEVPVFALWSGDDTTCE